MKSFNTVTRIVCACINIEVFWWKCGKQLRRTWRAHGQSAQCSIYVKWFDNNLPFLNLERSYNRQHRKRSCVSTKKGQAGSLPKHPWNFITIESTCNGIKSPKFNLTEPRVFSTSFFMYLLRYGPRKKGPKRLMRRKENFFTSRENVCFPFSAMVDPMRSPWNFNILILPLRRFLFTPKEFRFINFTFQQFRATSSRAKCFP